MKYLEKVKNFENLQKSTQEYKSVILSLSNLVKEKGLKSLDHFQQEEVVKTLKTCRLTIDYQEIIEKLEKAKSLDIPKKSDLEQVS